MTNDEAIDVLKRNYPSSCFEDLCEAVDIAIKALSTEQQRYMVTMAESMDIDRLKGIITKPSDITLIPLPKAEPEIIRCKDCKHYQFADNRAFGMPVKMCEWFGFEDVDDDDFCSRAERRKQ